MKTIEEINKLAPYHPCEWQQGYGIWQAGFVEGEKSGVTDQQKIDIERVRKWICTNCEYSENCEFSSPDNCPTITSITKAMEGEE